MLSSQEKNVFGQGYKIVAGIDEAGRGPLAGPVAAASLSVELDSLNKLSRFFRRLERRLVVGPKEIRDSKHLSPKQREEIFEAIKNEPELRWGISFVYPKTIDRINIWQATLLAWKRSLKKLGSRPDFLFLDGPYGIPRLKIKQEPIIKGDQKIWLLALASVIAKVSRDRLIERAAKRYPDYGFELHKGYGTKLHLERLKKFGPCKIHRKSFQPVFESLSFKERVYYVVSRIPKGQVMSYKEVAEMAGCPRAYRAVGNILSENHNPDIPCHRIIRADGKWGNYNKGPEKKQQLLQAEGILLSWKAQS